MNKVILYGRLTAEPELRQTPNGISVMHFTVAVKRRFAKEGQQQTDFINCVAWRNTAEFISKYFSKGQSIIVSGSIQSRSWDDKDGKKWFATEVIVDEADFAGSKPGSANSSQNNTSGSAPSNPPPQTSTPNTNDFNYEDFSDIDSSEDDLPF